MIEAEVHSSLREFLRAQGQPGWPHHLTMARLVARALRLGRSALIQTGTSQGRYNLSYLTPALLWKEGVILVTPLANQKKILQEVIPPLQVWLETNKTICTEDCLPIPEDFNGLLLISPATWLAARLSNQALFPLGLTTLIPQADKLEAWTRQHLTTTLTLEDWQLMMADYPHLADLIRDVRVQLTKAIFAHPQNPYECYLLEAKEREQLNELFHALKPEINPLKVNFWQQCQSQEQLAWASVTRPKGNFTLHCAPVTVHDALSPLWQQQPVVLMGSFLDQENQASIYRQQIGLSEDITCVKFSPHRQTEHIQLYLPDFFPLPNTPQFRNALMQELATLLNYRGEFTHREEYQSLPGKPNLSGEKLVVIIIDDVPLKAQVGSNLAAQFGSLVQVEKPNLMPGGILITGWQFWQQHQESLPVPQLLVIATLPLPSLENPLVAGRVAYYKSKRQDWFRLYLLPTAVQEIQRAILPLRESQGVAALLDSRVNYRSYGKEILKALEPYAKINYLDSWW